MDCSDLNEIEGLKFMPVMASKQPIKKGWQASGTVYDLSNVEAVGLVCGDLSGKLQAVDIDCKYDITGTLYDDYKRKINKADPELLKKLVVQSTKGKGYHFIFRCEEIAGNEKLANRHTTEEEKNATYEKAYSQEILKSKTEKEAVEVATKARNGDTVRVLIETRGLGGYIMCAPSDGYKLIFRDYYGISDLTANEREILLSCAREMNEVFEQEVEPTKLKAKIEKQKGISPFEDYNSRGDVISLLQSHGWKCVSNRGKKTLLLRPGQTTAQSSGNFDHDRNWFSVFTTSTEFQPEKAYQPYAVFCMLECKGDYSEAAKRLYDLGYGERHEEKAVKQSTRVIESRISLDDNDLSFLAEPKDYEPTLTEIRNGTLQQGLTTGFPSLDKHLLHKQGNLVMNNGIDNTGKSTTAWYLYLLAAMLHGWKGLIFSSENTLAAFMRKVIQFYWGKPLYGQFAMTQAEYDEAHAFCKEHFKLIKAQEDLYNYKDIINMAKKSRIKYPDLNYAMIDPYNSLKMNLSGFSKLSSHEYHYEALSEFKAYGQATNFGWMITNHAVTGALRAKDGDSKFPVAPRKEDTEGGGKFANKADDFWTNHRITQHPTDWNITEIHVRKVKDTETGGKPSPYDKPVKLEMYKGQCAFKEKFEAVDFEFDSSLIPIDPVVEWHKKRGTFLQTELTSGVLWNSSDDDEEDLQAPF